jgi:hypothetical protein
VYSSESSLTLQRNALPPHSSGQREVKETTSMKQSAYSYEMSVNFYLTTWHIPQKIVLFKL